MDHKHIAGAAPHKPVDESRDGYCVDCAVDFEWSYTSAASSGLGGGHQCDSKQSLAT